MFSRLDEVERRFEELAVQLSDPKVLARQDQSQKLSKEYSDLKEIVESYRAYKRVARELAESHELAKERDPEVAALAKAELADLEAKKSALEQHLQVLLLPKDPNDGKNVFVEIRAGTGGDEASLFAADLLRVYLRFAERQGWQSELITKSETGLKGIKEAVVLLKGRNVYSHLKYEGGVHRVQRVPVTEQSGRIHTSAATVAVLPEAEEVEVKIDDKDLQVDVMRAGGPGGQSVNTTDSAVRITHIPSGLVVYCQDEKSQHKNKAKALGVLRARLLEAKTRKQNAEIASQRKSMVGSGDRSERIRTYNFPQNRVTDHRISLTLHKLDSVMDGALEEIVNALRHYYQTEMLKGGPGSGADGL
ncbi:MAG: peptide chain release factor 1 [Pseudomonadota bacterium]